MKQLLEQDPIAMGMLGKQEVRNLVYRSLTYVLTEEEADCKIYFNLLTHEMIMVNLNELDSPDIRKYFIENWYLVPEGHDDQQLVDECRAVLTLMNSAPKNIHTFHIYTTLDCNARCFYCYEKRMPGSNMTTEIASRVIEYMKEQADGNPIKIVWFGGEPLVNSSIIDYIIGELWKKGIHFESEMFSNGLLFDNSLVEKAKNLWNLKNVQITLDGTSQVYRKVKAYVTDVEDPLETVLQNVKKLLKAGMKVQIRLNIGLHNYRDMYDLVGFLYEKFKGEENIYVYVSPMFEIIQYTDDKKKYIYGLTDELNTRLNNLFRKKKEDKFFRKIANSYCMASGREAVTILPDGKVGVCTNLTNEIIVGDVFNSEIDETVREEFGKRFYRKDKCKFCLIYPNCYVVNGCPVKDKSEGCDSVRVQMNIKRIRKKMKIKCRQNMFEGEIQSAQ